MGKKRTVLSAILLVASGALAAAWVLLAPPPRTSGPMPHEAYVWQRAWTPPLRQAVDRANADLSRLVVLTAEVSFASGRPRTVRVRPDYATLKATGRSVGLAVRIGAYRGSFDPDAEGTRYVADLAAAVVGQARAAGLTPAELQIDFDCPERRLGGYRHWVRAVRQRIAPVPVTITALPSWLDRRAFRPLVEAADGYVLQVHSVQRPREDGKMSLCDPRAAQRAVDKAARAGRPFRVALPTYGYVAAFDRDGKLVGLSAEGPSQSWPPSVRLRVIRADPEALADLVRAWTQDRPAAMTGIIWYRLPVRTDRLNWPQATLAAVMAGRTPTAQVQACVRRVEPKLLEIDLVNAGTAPAGLDVHVQAHWQEAKLIAADALGGFRRLDAPPGRLVLQGPRDPLAPLLDPGEKRTIGWIRLDWDREVTAHVTSP